MGSKEKARATSSNSLLAVCLRRPGRARLPARSGEVSMSLPRRCTRGPSELLPGRAKWGNCERKRCRAQAAKWVEERFRGSEGHWGGGGAAESETGACQRGAAAVAHRREKEEKKNIPPHFLLARFPPSPLPSPPPPPPPPPPTHKSRTPNYE